MSDYFVVGSDGLPHIDKDPNAQIPFAWDWTDWLAAIGAASVSSATVTAEAGLTVVGGAIVNSPVVSQLMSGGTAGSSYRVYCRVTANTGAIDDRSIVIDVKER